MKKLKAMWLLFRAKGFYMATNRGVASRLPVDIEIMQEVQSEVEKFDIWLEALINDLILEERNS